GCAGRWRGPRIAFDSERQEIGSVAAPESTTARFHFSNIGTAPLRISNVDISCGCLSPEFPQVVAPGAEGEIRVRFEPQPLWSGKITKELVVHSNDPRQRLVTLRLDANVTPYVSLDPPAPI